MTPREHALLARTLIHACGGIDEAATACDVRRSSLSNYQNPNHEASMPGQVIDCLERYCGKPIYSRALIEQHTLEIDEVEDLVEEVSDATETVAALQSAARKAAKDGKFTQTELDILARIHRRATEELRDAGAAIQRQAD